MIKNFNIFGVHGKIFFFFFFFGGGGGGVQKIGGIAKKDLRWAW